MSLFGLKNLFTHSAKGSSPLHTYLQNLLGVKKLDLILYERALTHSSHNERDNNERLEFLGDAVLDLIVSDLLEKSFPETKEGELTRIRSRLVRRETLNKLAAHIDLTEHIVSARKNTAGTSIPGNALEALIGAIYKDLGYPFTLNWVRQQLITDEMIERAANDDSDFKSRILIYGQKQKRNIEFQSSSTDSGEFKITLLIDGEIVADAQGRSKIEGEQRAAQLAIDKLSDL